MCAKKHVITKALFEVLNSTLNFRFLFNDKNKKKIFFHSLKAIPIRMNILRWMASGIG